MSKDAHTLRASEMFKVPYQEVTTKMRQAGKMANYVIMYSTKISLEEYIKNGTIPFKTTRST